MHETRLAILWHLSPQVRLVYFMLYRAAAIYSKQVALSSLCRILKDRRRRAEGGEWESIKILNGIWPMSQNQPETALFQPDQDRLAIDKLSAFGTGLRTVTKTRRDANKTTQRLSTRTRLKNSLSPLRHFTEHLVDVFGKLPLENNSDHNSSRLSIRHLKSTPGIQPATNFTHKHPATLQSQHTIAPSSEPNPEPGLQAPKPVSVHQRESHTQIKHLRRLNPQGAQALFRFNGGNEEQAERQAHDTKTTA
jgi:hypothetical protein